MASKRSESSIRAAFSQQEQTVRPKASDKIAPDALNSIFSTAGHSIIQQIKRIGWSSASSSSERTRNKLQKMVGARSEIHKMRDFIQHMANSAKHEQNPDDPSLVDYRRTFGNEELCLSIGRNEKGEINFAFLSESGGMPSSSTTGQSHSKKAALPITPAIPTHITAVDLGEKIGSGSNKDLYQLKTNPGLVVALQRHDGYFSPDSEELDQEVTLLDQLAKHGFPVVPNYGVVKVDNLYGILQDRIPGAKGHYEQDVTENLNQQSLIDLNRIEDLLQRKNLHIGDFQLLVGSDGKVFIIDPLLVEEGLDEANRAVIDRLRALVPTT